MKFPISAMIGVLLCITALAAAAQTAPVAQFGTLRTIPAAARRGEMQPPWQGQTSIDGTDLHLAPGAQIRDQHNRIILSDSVRQPLLVKYLTDANGQLFRVWVLTAEEAAAP
ncbi:hypothetical protein GALL_111230 [mine drainage metagenome]|uniref:Uncharacterized protein n=1 Tax=mine drainage metagenome TaxID=410659 RepID=A0A1J5SEM0_9ZZZZ